MYSRVFAGMLGILLAMMFMGIALADKENASTTDSIASPQIAITAANFVAPSPEKEHLNEEWVEITNLGTSDINLAGWTLSDAQNHTYTFPGFSLAAGAKVFVRTGKGDNDIENLFWNRSNSIWNNNGDLAVLKDPEGNTISMYPEEGKEA